MCCGLFYVLFPYFTSECRRHFGLLSLFIDHLIYWFLLFVCLCVCVCVCVCYLFTNSPLKVCSFICDCVHFLSFLPRFDITCGHLCHLLTLFFHLRLCVYFISFLPRYNLTCGHVLLHLPGSLDCSFSAIQGITLPVFISFLPRYNTTCVHFLPSKV